MKSLTRRISCLVVSIALTATGSIAISQEADDVDKLLQLMQQTRSTSPAPQAIGPGATPAVPPGDQAFLEMIGKFATFRDAQAGLTGTVAIGYTGDETSMEERQKASASLDLTLGRFPGQLRVSDKTQLEFGNKAFKEDLSKLRVNYDYYLRSLSSVSGDAWKCDAAASTGPTSSIRSDFELYGFIERQSDSYMFIDRRYEVGTGIKWELNSGSTTSKGAKQLADLNELCMSRGKARATLTDNTVLKKFDDLFPAGLLADAASSNQLDTSRFQFGLALSLLREMEKPGELETEYLTAAGDPLPAAVGKTKYKVAPAASSRNRISVRPSFIWRPTDEFALSGVYYYKLPLDSPRRVNGKRDYRIDTQLKASYTAAPLGSSKKQPTISLTIDWHKDNVPPMLKSTDNPLPDGAVAFSNDTAPGFHRTVELSVGVSF